MKAALAQFECTLISEQAAEGRDRQGQRRTARSQANTFKKQKAAILAEVAAGKKVTNIAIDFDVSRSMVYRVIESITRSA